MADKPILFSAPMVRALLAGTKTQTRRILKPQPEIDKMNNFCWGKWNFGQNTYGVPHIKSIIRHSSPGLRFPYAVGDRLWVREAWRAGKGYDEARLSDMAPSARIEYRATPTTEAGFGKWRPGMFMPRWASRLTLTVTDVRVQRLQDISEEDALAEGVVKVRDCCHVIRDFDYDKVGLCHTSPITPYAKFWDHLNGPGSWDANPWIVALTFDVRKGNIDG